MAKRRKPGRGQDARGRSIAREPFVRLSRSLLESEAWRSLRPADMAVYIAVERVYNGGNNGRIGLSVRQAADMANVNKDTAARSFERLEARGFIKKTQAGAFSWKVRHATEWTLTAHPVGDDPASREFASWTAKSKPGPNRGDNLSQSKGPTVPIGGTHG